MLSPVLDETPRSLAPLVLKVGYLAVLGMQVALIPAVLVRRKESASTIAWILSLIFLPVLGGFLFVLFGRDRVRLSATAKRRAKAVTQERIRSLVTDASDGSAGGLPAASEQANLESRLSVLASADRPIFRVGGLLGHTAASAGNRVRIYATGSAAIDDKLAAIDSATTSVHAEYYLIRNDVTGRDFRDRLIAAARRGVTVRLMVDGFGSIAVDGSWVDALAEGHVELARFLPMRALGAGLQSRFLGAFQWNLRNHRKILVVDGRVAFSGGVNIGDDVRSWRDTHLRIEGPACQALQSIFLEDWEFATARAVGSNADFPTLGAADDADAIEPRGVVEIVASGPDTANEAIHRVFFAAIASARKKVAITTPYFVPDRAILVALQTAALSGVSVVLLVPGKSNHRVTWFAGRSYYEELLEAGVEIHEYQPGLIHAKTIVVDDRIALVGSANMDMRSFRLNYEVHAVIRDADVARELGRIFADDLAKARPIDLPTFRARPWRSRVAEGFGRLMSPLL